MGKDKPEQRNSFLNKVQMKLQTLCERILNLVCYYESEGRCTFDAVRAEKIRMRKRCARYKEIWRSTNREDLACVKAVTVGA